MIDQTKLELRQQIDQRVLELKLKILGEAELDPEKLKLIHAMSVDAEKLELAARKLEGADELREFSAEETIEGIHAMLGRGSEE
jgi:hypothetical protein